MEKKSQIVLLGTGTPNAEPERHGPAVAVIVNQTPYIVDCGPGIVRQAAAAYQAGITGLDLPKLCRVFITHLHSDHTLGYPDLIFTPWVLEREEPVHVYGPPGIQDMTDHILAAYQLDIHERLHGLEPANDKGHKVHVTEIAPGVIYQDQNVSIEAFRVKHGSWPAYGYKFFTPDRSIVISGDTAPFEGMAEMYQGCDVLIHEVHSAIGLKQRTSDWRTYHSNVHTSSHELAEIAEQAQPGLVILYHQILHEAVSEEDLLREVQDRYDGAVVSGKDLEVY